VKSETNQVLIEDLTLVPVPQWYQNPWLWLFIAALIVTAFYFFRRYLKSRPLPLKPFVPEPPGPPPHEEALKRLEELRNRHAKLTAYQVALECSDILRRYIERRFSSPIRFQTTREFLGAVHSSPELSAESRSELGDFLKFFDEIKFAQQAAEPARTSAAIDGAERFVRRCVPPMPSPQ
jgi:hypothetical protein